MGTMDLNQAIASDMSNKVDLVTVDSLSVDSPQDLDETAWPIKDWEQNWGYFNVLPDLKSAILMKAIWNVGKGYAADIKTQTILDHISGWGKDTFEDILFNMEVVKRIGGDAFAEIIRDDEGTLINLKPLDPGSMTIILNRQGMIKRYEQRSKVKGTKPRTFKPEEIFHLCNNRLADQIHGISDIKAMEKVILAENENFEDMRKIMHRQAKPMIMFKLGTDNATKINAFVSKMDAATNKGENIYIPDDENAVSFEVIQVNVSQIILDWRNDLRNKFYRAVGLPQIIFGTSGSTESGGKIEYLAHEQIFEKEQKAIERQIWEQLNLKIDLVPPTTLLDNLKQDEAKDANQGLAFQANDMTAGAQ